MRLVRRICTCVVEHRIKCRSQGLDLYNSRKDRTIADLRVDHERWPLRDPERVKFSCGSANPLFDFRRSGMLAQFFGLDPAGFSTDFNGNIPVTDLSAITHRRIRKCKANAIVDKTKVLRSF